MAVRFFLVLHSNAIVHHPSFESPPSFRFLFHSSTSASRVASPEASPGKAALLSARRAADALFLTLPQGTEEGAAKLLADLRPYVQATTIGSKEIPNIKAAAMNQPIMFQSQTIDDRMDGDSNFQDQLSEAIKTFDKHMVNNPTDPGAMGAMKGVVPGPIVDDIFHDKVNSENGSDVWFAVHKRNMLRMGVAHLPLVGVPCIIKCLHMMAVQLIPMDHLLRLGIVLDAMPKHLETTGGADYMDSDICHMFRVPAGARLASCCTGLEQ